MIARLLPALALIVVLLGGVPAARATDAIQVTRATIAPDTDGAGWKLSADFYIPLSARMREVLQVGVPIYFMVEFTLQRGRWWWRDERVASAEQEYRLSYHPITRRYRLAQSGYPVEFSSLEEAIASLSRIRGWSLLEDVALDPERAYTAALRMRLDTGRLPGPLQVDALTNQDWNLKAPWTRFTVRQGNSTSVQ